MSHVEIIPEYEKQIRRDIRPENKKVQTIPISSRELRNAVEWICWLNGQRKRALTPEEMADMEARRERVRHNVALLKKEEEERRAKAGSNNKRTSTGKIEGPDLKSFVQQFPVASEDGKNEDTSAATSGTRRGNLDF